MSCPGEDLIDAAEVAEILGLAHRNSVSTYRRRYADFPAGEPNPSGGRGRVWARGEITAWRRAFSSRAAQDESEPSARLELLVEATARLLLAHPGTAITIRQIASEAGIAHSDLYRYADSKDQLVTLAVAQLTRQVAFVFPDTLEGLVDVADQVFDAVRERANAVRVMAHVTITHPDAEPTGPVAAASVVPLIVRHRREAGIDSPVDPEVVAACAASLMLGWVLFEARWRTSLGITEAQREQVPEMLRQLLLV